MREKRYTKRQKGAIETEFTENTKLIDILKAYPALETKLKEKDERFSIISSPMGKLLLKTKTVKDASKMIGIPVPELLQELDRIIQKL